MNERFNFYDIYGYLLPGGLLFILLWFPFGLLLNQWPPAGWGSAAIGLGLAYITGHLIHALSEAAFPSKVKDKDKNERHPSDLLLDNEGEKELLPQYRLGEMKEGLAKQIEGKFNIKIDVNAKWTKDLAIKRSVAFFKCRSFLIEKKAAAYAEQHQGMYALMRGSGAAFVLASALYFGLAIGYLLGRWIPIYLILTLFFGILAIAFISGIYCLSPHYERTARKILLWIFTLILVSSGMIATQIIAQSSTSLELFFLLFALAAIAGILSFICFSAYKAFAIYFAATVYRDFSMYIDTSQQIGNGPSKQ